MTAEIELAKKHGIQLRLTPEGTNEVWGYVWNVQAFAEAVRAAERERCAVLCDAVAHIDSTGYGIAEDCAAAIRGGLTTGFMQAQADEAPRLDLGA